MKKTHTDSEIEGLLKEWKPSLDVSPKKLANTVDAIMRKVNALPTPRPWWKSLFDLYHFELNLRPATAVALVFVIGISLGYWMHRSPSPSPTSVVISTVSPPEPQGEKQHLVKFVYMDPNARSVGVIGDFNNWQQTPLQRQAGGLWTLTVPVTAGEYNYQFVIDGKKFVTDPAAPEESDDGFGQTDSVLKL